MQTLACQTTCVSSFDYEKLYCVAQGNLQNPTQTFIFISGIGGGATSWAFLVEYLLTTKPKSLCITYDIRGHSQSSHIFPKGERSFIDVITKDLQAILVHYKVVDPIFVGHSLGGLVMQNYLQLEYQPAPKKLVFLNTPLSVGLLPAGANRLWYPLLSFWSRTVHFSYKTMSSSLHEQYRNSFDFSPTRIYHDITTIGFLPFLLFWACVLSWKIDSTEKINALHPTLIFGSKDLVVTTHKQKKIQKILDKSTVYMISTNHNSIVNEPKKVAEILGSL